MKNYKGDFDMKATVIKTSSPEENRFESISDFKECISHGGEVDFEWKGVRYGAVRYGTNNKICVYEANKQETEKVCETVDEALEYMVGEDRLRDVITQVTVWDRTI